MSCIQDLPEELLDSILRHVKETTSPTEFWDCLRTCRRWHRVGLGAYNGVDYAASAIIESDVRAREIHQEEPDINIKLFTDFDLNPPSHLFLAELRSLTVHVHHARTAAPFKPATGQDLFASLSKAFSRMRRLTTFSLKFSEDGWDYPTMDIPAIPQSRLASLVRALPDTIVNLELDTASADIPPSDDLLSADSAKHLCHQINRILLRLQHLRLRVSHVCGTLLSTPPPQHSDQERAECNSCGHGAQAVCRLLRDWNMRGMTIWLHYSVIPTDTTFENTLSALIKPVLRCRSTIMLVRETYFGSRDPQELAAGWGLDARRRVLLSTESNIPFSTRQRLQSWVDRVYGIPGSRNIWSSRHFPCEEHQVLRSGLYREFEFGGQGRTPISPFPYMAEWALEYGRRWAQHEHLGSRYPVVEGDAPSKPFFQCNLFSSRPVPPQYISMEAGGEQWACLFPGCHIKCPSFLYLRGHQSYAHPGQPHKWLYSGLSPCPSNGCDRVGQRGFRDAKDLEQHLLDHHRKLCTM